MGNITGFGGSRAEVGLAHAELTPVERALEIGLLDMADEAVREALRAQRKHGPEAMLNPQLPQGKRVTILGEEFGEVCRALNYDTGSPEELRKELVQTAAMCLAWLVAEFPQIDHEKEFHDSNR